jgi:2-oxoacid:acceptor oxidoreductase delta subunit (pyruvate/2-ketoisovalerate family)
MSLPRATGMPTGGTVVREEAVRNRTAGWRTGVKPRANLDLCVNCKLCWVYCPDSAVLVESGVFRGFDYDVCKGCEICAEMCPVDAIEMVPESDPLPPRGLINGGSDA